MGVALLSALLKTGQFVSPEMFGANAIFSETADGVPTAAFESATQALAAQNIRFGGGQADLDPQNANSAGQYPLDGETSINVVDMPDGVLRPELVNFLDWCIAQTAAGYPTETTLIIPTKHLNTAEYEGFAADIEAFVQTVMQQYGEVIAAFQIGNEYWEMGETAYGTKASLAAVAISNGLEAAEIEELDQPDILVQMATAGNEGSEFPATPGISDFQARNAAANAQIIDQLSDDARSAIDGVTEHYYYNREDYSFLPAEAAVKNINKDYDVWEQHFEQELDLYVTEWNVKTSATAQHGIVAASTLIKQFENMIEIGVDGAHIWALDYHSRTAPTLPSDAGVFLDDQGRLTNSAQGAAFDLMSEALIGKELVTATFLDVPPGIEITSYAAQDEIVFYVSSRSFEQSAFTLNLATKLPDHGPVNGVHIGIDPASSNGLQWERGVAADSVLIDGQPYYYNEHDVDVILTDVMFDDLSQIDLMLNPFEVVQLTAALTPPPLAREVSQDVGYLDIEGTSGQAYRLYQASFDRAPDVEGLQFWTSQLDQGVTLVEAAQMFLDSAEFVTTFGGALTDDAYLDLLYANVLDRAPDQAGLAFWQTQEDVSRAEMLMAFSESAENKSQVGIDDGIWII